MTIERDLGYLHAKGGRTWRITYRPAEGDLVAVRLSLNEPREVIIGKHETINEARKAYEQVLAKGVIE